MFRRMTVAASLAVALGVFAMSSLLRAEDAPAPAAMGTLKGTVVDEAGKAVANAKVAVLPARHKHAPGQNAAGDAKPNRPEPIAKAETDADGKFSLQVPAGEYMVNARLKGSGRGNERVTVEAGKNAAVTITLKARQPRGNQGPGADKGPKGPGDNK